MLVPPQQADRYLRVAGQAGVPRDGLPRLIEGTREPPSTQLRFAQQAAQRFLGWTSERVPVAEEACAFDEPP